MLRLKLIHSQEQAAAGGFAFDQNVAPKILSDRKFQRAVSAVARHSVLLLSDLFSLLLSCAIGYLVWADLMLGQPATEYVRVAPLVFLIPLMYAAGGLYPGFGLGAVETLRRLSCYTSLSFVAVAAASFVLKADPIYSRMAFGVAWLTALGGVPLMRFLMLSLVSGLAWWGESTVIFGTRAQAQMTIRSLKGAFSLGYHVVGVLIPDRKGAGELIEGVPVLGGVELVPLLSEGGVTTVVAWDSPQVLPSLMRIHHQFRHIVMIRDARTMPTERVRIRNLGGVLGMEFTNELLHPRNRLIKRFLDVVFGGILLVVAAPAIAICAILVKLVSPGSAFFRQERQGLLGQKISVWKLRTMHPDAEMRLNDYLAKDPELARQWREKAKLERDPRIIPIVGNVLRRFSIDELPQLWNVVTGEMSLVGPRPFPDYHLKMLPKDFRELRIRVRPGLTGMWQVMVRSGGGLTEQELYDTFYIRNWSVWLDLYLLARTAFAVVAARGAY